MARTQRTGFYTNWQGNQDAPPVWTSTPAPTAVDEFGDLSYDLLQHCTGVRASNPFEILVSSPEGAPHTIVENVFGGSNLTPGGTFTFIVRAYNETGQFADSPEFSHTVNAAVVPLPVWNSVPAPSSVADGGDLNYDLSQDCTGFRASQPFELLSITPAGSNIQVAGTFIGGSGLTPQGSYTCEVRAYNENGQFADSGPFTFSITAAQVDPDPPVAVAAGYVPMFYEFKDDFSNGRIVDAQREPGYWTPYTPPGGSVAETGGRAVLTTGGLFGDGNKPYIRSRLDFRNNVCCGPVEFIYENVDVDNGEAVNYSDQRLDFYLTDTGASTNGDEFYFAETAIAIRMQRSGANSARIWIGSKQNSPNSPVSYTNGTNDEAVPFKITKMRAIHWMTGYFVEVFGAGASDYMMFRGRYEITDGTNWGRRGDAYHTVQVQHNFSEPTNENVGTVGPITVRSMLYADSMSASDPLDPGYAPGYLTEAAGQTDGTVIMANPGTSTSARRFEASGIGANRFHTVGTPINRHHNPFVRPDDSGVAGEHGGCSVTAYSEAGPGNTDGTCRRIVGWSSDPDVFAAKSCILAAIDADGTVGVYTKEDAPNTVPTITQGTAAGGAGALGVKLRVDYLRFSLSSINADGTFTERKDNLNHNIDPKNWDRIVSDLWSSANASLVHGVWRTGDNSNIAQADFTGVYERRETRVEAADSVLGPAGDSQPMDFAPIHESQYLAGGGRLEHGIISNARPPFNMARNNSGVTAEEITEARRHCAQFCREWGYARVTPQAVEVNIAGQEEWLQSLWVRAPKLGSTDDPRVDEFNNGYLSPNYDMPIYDSGGMGTRPKLTIAADTPAYQNVNAPQSAVYLWHRGRKTSPTANRNPWDTQANDGMGCTLRDYEFVVEAGNPGANGVSWRGAQAVSCRNVKVTMNGGLNAFEGGPGSGGEFYQIEAIGGKRGINAFHNIQLYDGSIDSKGADGAQPVMGVYCSRFENQSDVSIAHGSQSAMQVYGCEFYPALNKSAIRVANQGYASAAEREQFSVIDCYIEYPTATGGNVPFQAAKTVYFENVYIKNPGSQLLTWLSNSDNQTGNPSNPIATPISVPAGKVLHIKRFCQGITGKSSLNSINRNTVVIDGVVLPGDNTGWVENEHYEYVDEADVPSMDVLQAKWKTRDDIHFEDPNLAWPVLTENQRLGIDKFDLQQFMDDNGHKIAIPKAYINIDATVNPQALGAQMVSLRPMGRIVNRKGENFASITPLIETANDENGDFYLREVTLWTTHPNVNMLLNLSGKAQIDSPWIEERNFGGWGGSGLSASDRKLIEFRGANAGGFICSIDNGRDFSETAAHRKLFLNQAGQAITGFGINLEHNKSDGALEIYDCADVTLGGFKFEGACRLVVVRSGPTYNGEGKIRLHGFGGNGSSIAYNQSANNYTAPPGSGAVESGYTGSLPPAPNFQYYPPAGASTVGNAVPYPSSCVILIGDNKNVLITQTQMIANSDDGNPNWSNVYGIKFRGDKFRWLVDENGAGADYLSGCTGAGDADDERPGMYLKGNVDYD